MRANHHSTKFLATKPLATKLLALASAAVLASCTAIPPAPPSTQASTPPSTQAPAQAPAPAPAAPAPKRHADDWRDAPQTPGDWSWSKEGSLSVARFGGNTLVLSCNPAARTVTLSRPGAARAPVPITILTVGNARALTGTPVAGNPASIAVSLPARDSVLDAMAFTRGRFAVETSGLPTLYVPSWPEVSRVIEDCR